MSVSSAVSGPPKKKKKQAGKPTAPKRTTPHGSPPPGDPGRGTQSGRIDRLPRRIAPPGRRLLLRPTRTVSRFSSAGLRRSAAVSWLCRSLDPVLVLVQRQRGSSWSRLLTAGTLGGLLTVGSPPPPPRIGADTFPASTDGLRPDAPEPRRVRHTCPHLQTPTGGQVYDVGATHPAAAASTSRLCTTTTHQNSVHLQHPAYPCPPLLDPVPPCLRG